MSEDEIREDLSKAGRQKTSLSGPHGVHPQVPRGLAGGLARPLHKGDAPEDWKKAKSPWAEEQRSGRESGRAAGPRGWWPVAPSRVGGQGGAVSREARGSASRWRQVVLAPGCALLWAPQCKAAMAILERTLSPVPPPVPLPLSVGLPALVSWSQQPAETAARSCAGCEEAGSGRAATSTGTGGPLPILAIAGWRESLVPGEGPPVPGAMGQANCCCGSR